VTEITYASDHVYAVDHTILTQQMQLQSKKDRETTLKQRFCPLDPAIQGSMPLYATQTLI
jgi:hypothetical protein